MRLLFLFLDGVGLGLNDPEINPFARAEMPVLQQLLGGQRLVASRAPYWGERVSLVSLDACLGVPGVPQSATGQAVLLTGQNIPALVGYHFGPKPDEAVAGYLKNGNLFQQLKRLGKQVAFLNAYPPRYFESIASGQRLYSAIPLAAVHARVSLRTEQDLRRGRALSVDFTGKGWQKHLKIKGIPTLSPDQAGQRLCKLAGEVDFALFEYWLSDYAGHGQQMEQACQLLATFDQVLGGLLAGWDDDTGLILITSDHGNLEDLGTRRHTLHPVPALVIGAAPTRQAFLDGLQDITGITPAIQRLVGGA